MANLKPAFQIPISIPAQEPFHQLIEAGHYAITQVWYQKEPYKLLGLRSYQFTRPVTEKDIREIKSVAEPLENRPQSVIICYDTREVTLLPEKFAKPGMEADTLAYLFGHHPNMKTFQSEVPDIFLHVLYRIPATVHQALTDMYPGAQFLHSSMYQLPAYVHKSRNLVAIFFHQTIKLFLYESGALKIVQYLPYQTASDAVYAMLNLCSQHHVEPAEIRLQLSGMIEKRSPLFNELFTVFRDISFDEIPEFWTIPESMDEIPQHYFSHVIELAACAS